MTDIWAASGSPADIQTAVDTAIIGDTVRVPAGDFTFNPDYPAGVNILGGVNIIGAGADQTFLRQTQMITQASTSMFTVNGENGEPSRISGFTFLGYIDNVADESLNSKGVLMNRVNGFRVDHCNFQDFTSQSISITDTLGSYPVKGVVDHCNVDLSYKDVIGGEWGYGVLIYLRSDSWLPIDTYLGQYVNGTVFIEDCSFSRCRHSIASNGGGAWYVVRHCIFTEPRPKNYGMIDVHGSDPGGRGLESYNNSVYAASGYTASMAYAIRGGSGVIWNNNVYDCRYGVAMADDSQATQYRVNELYVWNNNWVNVAFPIYDQFNQYTENVNYFLYERPGYAPYPYPHPLAAETPHLLTVDSNVNNTPFIVRRLA